MNENQGVYWLAVAAITADVSYEELKHRMVIANGWPALNLESLLSFADAENREAFDAIFSALFKRAYPDGDAAPVARVFFDLLQLKNGDLIVAIEGTRVVGITELKVDAISTYRHDAYHEYANAFCYGSVWIDWATVSSEFAPVAPAKGVKGIKRLQQDREKVLAAWNTYKNR